MKKAALIFGIILILIVCAIITIPVIFKKPLLEKTKTTLSKQLGADVEFTDFNISLFQSFPNLNIDVQNLIIVGRGEFKNDTLLKVSSLRSELGILSVFNSKGAKIERLLLQSPQLKLLVNNKGKTNWDLSDSQEIDINNSEKVQANNNEGFKLGLEDVEIVGADIKYIDYSSGIVLAFDNTNINLSGKMYGSLADLNVVATVDGLLLKYDSLSYISNTSLKTKSVLTVDYEAMDIFIKENELLVNNLPLVLTGSLKMPNDSMFFDLDFKSKKSGLNELLALIPEDYKSYLNGLTASGNAMLSGDVKGVYIDENYPAFNITADVSGGVMQYEGLPEKVEKITADIKISKPQGVLDITTVDIAEVSAVVKENPLVFTLNISDLFNDPFFDGALIGNVNFSHLKEALPLDSVNISGEVDVNLFVKASYSSMLNEQYNLIKSDGIVYLNDFSYSSQELTKPVVVPNGKLKFSPTFVELMEMNVRIGQSDFSLSGKVANYLGYYLNKSMLSGKLELNSNFLNLNELMHLQSQYQGSGDQENVEAELEKTKMLAFDIPENLDLRFTSDITRANFGSLAITDINGLITAKSGKLVLDGLKMNLFNGQLKLTGAYENNKENTPGFDFGFDFRDIDLPTISRTLVSFQNLMPSTSRSKGKISTTLKMKGYLNQELKIIPASIDGLGILNTSGIEIIDSPTFGQLRNVLKIEKLKNISINDFKANFNVVEGNLLLKPFKTKIAGQQTTVNGSLNTEDLLDVKMDFLVERSAFGNDIQQLIEVIPGQETINLVPVTVLINGPVGKPDVKIDYSETRKYVADKVKNSSKESLMKSLDKVGKGLKKFFKK